MGVRESRKDVRPLKVDHMRRAVFAIGDNAIPKYCQRVNEGPVRIEGSNSCIRQDGRLAAIVCVHC
jgi:hypothetical protein